MLNALKYETYRDYCKSRKSVAEYVLPKALWEKLKAEDAAADHVRH